MSDVWQPIKQLMADVQHLAEKCDNTWSQYWPKIANIVSWMRTNAQRTGEDLKITEPKFLQFLADLEDGSFKVRGE